ncbi:mannosyltransferase OCH1-like enzyme [Dysgonomonadaceae bacterium PH5-43]|nr:mannosyltransferase OCH1-like enzyme [Dysgonomonadaceae bacterium PH5-43]
MIPKKIHYLWLSEEKPQNIIDGLQTWKEHLKDYEIIEWNKTNFPYNDFIWTREALSVQKWAFVTDFFRLWVLKNYGGIYLDADIVVRNNFDAFLHHKMFISTEFTEQLGPHAIGAEKGHPFISKCLEYYNDRHFIVDGKNDELTIPRIMTKLFMQEYNYKGKIASFDGTPLEFDNLTIYNDTFFTINIYDGNNICYHNYMGSWTDKKHSVNKSIVDYCSRRFFARDMYIKDGIAKYIIPFMPCFLVKWYYNRRMTLKNIKRITSIKI